MEKRTTPAGNTYWDANGAYQKELDELFNKLVPASGEAETVHGELVRAVNRLYYEYCNNGNCNAIVQEYVDQEYDCWSCSGTGEREYHDHETDEWGSEDCDDCYGNGYNYEEELGDRYMDSYYDSMLEFIRDHVPNSYPVVDALERFILDGPGYSNYQFNDAEYEYYNDLVDTVMHYVLNSENALNPEYKPEKV